MLSIHYNSCIVSQEKNLRKKHELSLFYWEGISYSSGENDWKIIEKDNLEIALNVFHAKKK